MGSFQRVDTTQLVRGPGRFMYAPASQSKPVQISDVIDLTAGSTLYDPATGYVEFGATTQGIHIVVNNTEVSFDIDQISGVIGTAPDVWSCAVNTQLAEYTLEHLVLAFEGTDITVNTTPTPYERMMGFAGATSYTERRLAILFQRPPDATTGQQRIQLYFFHRSVHAPQQVSIDFQKGGTEMTIPISFNCLADATELDPRAGFGYIFEQEAA